MPVAVIVARIPYYLTVAREDIGPVYKQHEVFRPGFEKDLVQPFLRFTDLLAYYTGAIDLVKVGLLFVRYDPCRDGLVEEGLGSAAFCLTR